MGPTASHWIDLLQGAKGSHIYPSPWGKKGAHVSGPLYGGGAEVAGCRDSPGLSHRGGGPKSALLIHLQSFTKVNLVFKSSLED